MKYFIFNFKDDVHLIESFLESASLSHKQEKKDKDWFFWKFRENPFGKSILVCAKEDDKIVGCVAYGIQLFTLEDKTIKGVLSFETFVHPAYQGKGIFSKLIKLGEETVKAQNTDIMLNFPNANSLKGFLNSGWKQINSPEYWIKGNSILTIPLNFRQIRKGFIPSESNFDVLKPPDVFKQKTDKQFKSLISLDYLKWRFHSYPVAEYVIVHTENYYSVIRMGVRGNVREGQVLFVELKNNKNFKITSFIKEAKSHTEFDILSFSISKNNKMRSFLKNSFFLKVPNNTNICYKILNTDFLTDEDVKNISLSAINYHTY
ncbi:MAG: GNAT family N-acetyltransferase [Lutibacter sp.]